VGALGVGGSLITRPEILTRALVKGGTEEQKQRWLPRLASGEVLAAVAVTEPDFGSDVAGVTTSATKTDGGWLINGTKTWCTFAARADVLMLLARTDTDRSTTHRGLSLFSSKSNRPRVRASCSPRGARGTGHGQGRLEGRPIDTIGYRGMHSYELAFDHWFVPDADLVGGEAGLGRGFYFQMAGFENGRLQTTARALGSCRPPTKRRSPTPRTRRVRRGDHRLRINPSETRHHGHDHPVCAPVLTGGRARDGAAAALSRRRWPRPTSVARPNGHARSDADPRRDGLRREYPVSRYFVDARVLSIFEGADETLCLKVIARRLLQDLPA